MMPQSGVYSSPPRPQYIVVSGGVLSGLGKGIIASSVGVLLKASGMRVTSIKIDPYINIDAGTMSPFEHGECFVLEDGGETDLDLGNYERFLGVELHKDNNITTGKIYYSCIQKERRGDYLGKTVQVVPHICNEIQDWIEKVSKVSVDSVSDPPDVCVIELGGTIGDIESMPFVEALRQFQYRVGRENITFMHVSLVPILGEQKTKPTQNTVKELRAVGISPDFVMCRSSAKLKTATKEKISSFCGVPNSHVIGVHDVPLLYSVPVLLREQGVDQLIMEKLGRKFDAAVATAGFRYWKEIEEKARILHSDGASFLQEGSSTVRIAIVGKYTGLADSYLSVTKSLEHACLQLNRSCQIVWVEASDLSKSSRKDSMDSTGSDTDGKKDSSKSAWSKLKSCDGILIPGGFGERGIEGMVLAAKYARENNVPFLGICLGMQVAVIEFARHLGKADANSTEFNERCSEPVVIFMPEGDKDKKGGTMRLGARKTFFIPEHRNNSIMWKLYGRQDFVQERHRHRYEVEPSIVPEFERHGFHFVGRAELEERNFESAEDAKPKVRNEICEYSKNTYFVGVQYHPEFKSRAFTPSPPFLGLIAASIRQLDKLLN